MSTQRARLACLLGAAIAAGGAPSGTYRVDADKMRAAVDAYCDRVLRLQGDGDYAGALAFLPKPGEMDPELARDLAALASAEIPTDVVFRQGLEVLRGEGAAPER